jgi:TrmH family RNA methyltransferase
MISQRTQKYVRSLHQKKYRQESGAFLVEGAKNVVELLRSGWALEALFTTAAFHKENSPLLAAQSVPPEITTAAELERLGTLQTNDAALAVARIPENRPLRAEPGELVLVLDDLRDPGNLGTILRVADWYGLTKVVCSPTTVEVYNPKVIAASMGSFTRVRTYVTDLPAYLTQNAGMPVYGTFLDGENLHRTTLVASGYVVIGNEANGIGPAVGAAVTQRLTIPRFGGAESLNAGIATALVLDHWRRTRTD